MALSGDTRAQRKVTHGFILTQPVSLVLHRRQKVKKPAGGWAWEDNYPVDPQVMRLIEPTPSPRGVARPVVTADGLERTIDFTLLGEWDSDIALGDWFEHAGAQWEIVQLIHDNGYERRAIVSRRG